jgi:hypothetical protein
MKINTQSKQISEALFCFTKVERLPSGHILAAFIFFIFFFSLSLFPPIFHATLICPSHGHYPT